MRVLQVSDGMPFTSALQGAALRRLAVPAHRQVEASLAWIQCRASSTTIPSSTGTRGNWTKAPSSSGRHGRRRSAGRQGSGRIACGRSSRS